MIPPLLRGLAFAALLPLALTAKPLAPASAAGFGLVATPPPAARSTVALAPEEMPLGPTHYDTTPAPLPPNIVALDFDGSATIEFGDLVRLGGAAHYLDTATITLSSGAIRSDYAATASSPFGFTHPITLKLYAVDRADGTPRPGRLLASITHAFLIPWRPEPDPTSSSPLRPWKAADGQHYTGYACNLTFDLGALETALPDEIIYSISYNTEHGGPAPLGVAGPYNALRIGLSEQAPQPGSDPETDVVFWKTSVAANYADQGAAGTGTLRRDSGWTPHRPTIRFTNSAYGAIAETAAQLRALRSTDRTLSLALADAATLLRFALPRAYWDGNNRLRLGEGEIVFSALADAAVELTTLARSTDAASASATQALSTLQRAAQSLAEASVGDAIISGGVSTLIFRAEGALDEAYASETGHRPADAIEAYADAWREAQSAVR